MKIASYIEWVNSQKFLEAAVRDWLTDKFEYGRDLKITGIVFLENEIRVETESKSRQKRYTKVDVEEILKYMPDENI